MNYQTYLDEHIWQFIRDTARHFPDDAAQLSIGEQRRVYDRCATPSPSNGLAI